MKHLKSLSSEELQDLQTRVETALSAVNRPTKSIVLKVISDQGHCSPKSTGIEKSFHKLLLGKGLTVSPNLSALMSGTSVARQRPTVPVVEDRLRLTLLNLKAISTIEFGRTAKVSFMDGATASSGTLDVAALRQSSNLLELNR